MSREQIKASIENWRIVDGYPLQSIGFDQLDHRNLTLIGIFYSGRLLKGFIKDNSDDTILEATNVILTTDGFYGSLLINNCGIKTGYYDFNFNSMPESYSEYKSSKLHIAGTLGVDRNLAQGYIHKLGVSWEQGDFKNNRLHGMGIRHNYLSGVTVKGLFKHGLLIQGEINDGHQSFFN